MNKKIFMRNICAACNNATSDVKYSSWHYCNKPKEVGEFKIMRHFNEHAPGRVTHYKKELPDWCPER